MLAVLEHYTTNNTYRWLRGYGCAGYGRSSNWWEVGTAPECRNAELPSSFDTEPASVRLHRAAMILVTTKPTGPLLWASFFYLTPENPSSTLKNDWIFYS